MHPIAILAVAILLVFVLIVRLSSLLPAR